MLVALAACGALSFDYSRDRLGGMAVPFYALAAYFALRDLAQLDGGYTVFGQVVAGWETIDKIVALSERTDIARSNENANPGKLALIQHARIDSTGSAR